MIKRLIPLITLLALLLAACGGASQATEPPQPTAVEQAQPADTLEAAPQETGETGPRTLSVMTHDSFAVSEEVVAAFEAENDVDIQFIQSGDTGSALNRAILSKNNPLADVFYGVDNTFLSRALREGIFEPYESPLLEQIPDEFKLDPENRALPVDYGDVCLNYDKAYFAQQGLEPPQSLEDLLLEEYENLLVVENPATSSPGLAFLLVTINHYGEDGYLGYWESLVENGVLVAGDWETAYYSEFTAHGGTRPVVVSYNSSPPAEVIFAENPVDEPPTAAVTANQTCFRQIEFVGILQGAQNRDLAEKWIDFMLSEQFQEDMPLQMFVFPVNPQAELPEVFTQFVEIPQETAQVSPDEITDKREAWLQEWTETVLR